MTIAYQPSRSRRSRVPTLFCLFGLLAGVAAACSTDSSDLAAATAEPEAASTTGPSTTAVATSSTTEGQPFVGDSLAGAFGGERLGEGWLLTPGIWVSDSVDPPIAFATREDLALLSDSPGTVRVGLSDFAPEDLDDPSGRQNSFKFVNPALYAVPPSSATSGASAVPVPSDPNDFFESIDALEVVEQGTYDTSWGAVPWWELVSGPVDVLFDCPYGTGCAGLHIDRANALQDVPSGERYRLRLYQIPIDDVDLHLIVEGHVDSFDSVLDHALHALDTLDHDNIAATPVPDSVQPAVSLVGRPQIDSGEWFATIAGNDIRFSLTDPITEATMVAANDRDLDIDGPDGHALIIKVRRDFVLPEYTDLDGGQFPTNEMLASAPPGGTRAWLDSIDVIEVVATAESPMSGRTAQTYDVTVRDGVDFDRLMDCGGSPCAVLFRTKNSNVTVTAGSTLRIFDLVEDDLLILFMAPTADIEDWIETLSPILDQLQITTID